MIHWFVYKAYANTIQLCSYTLVTSHIFHQPHTTCRYYAIWFSCESVTCIEWTID